MADRVIARSQRLDSKRYKLILVVYWSRPDNFLMAVNIWRKAWNNVFLQVGSIPRGRPAFNVHYRNETNHPSSIELKTNSGGL